ncbi:MAG TPA: FtsX-like permease family protein [Nitrospiraceae bacterium]|nr:FtsX-like permease family protein [Nitrospiraceae bacterium]
MIRAILLIAARHVFSRSTRTLLTIVGVGLGVAVSVAIQAANVEVLKSFEETVTEVAGRATLQVSGGELGLDERIIERLRRAPHIMSASPVLQAAVRIAGGPHRGESFTLMGLDLLEAADLKGFQVKTNKAGDSLFDRLLSRDAVFLGSRVASDLGMQVGSSLTISMGLQKYEVVVQGIVTPVSHLSSVWDHVIVMDIAAAQALFGLVGRLDRIDLVTASGYSVDQIAQDLKSLLPPGLTVARPARRNEQVEHMVRAFQINLSMLSGVGLLVGLLLVYNTISFSVVQRRREIGMLSALGMPRSGISAVFLGEAALMGLIGGTVGGWLGMLLARSLVSLVSRTISDLYVPIDTALTGTGAGMLSFFRAPMSVWIQGGLLGMIVSVIGAISPSVDASRTAPARALAPGDYEAGQGMRAGLLAWTGLGLLLLAGLLALPGPVAGIPFFGYLSALCLLMGLSCLTPVLVHRLGARLPSSVASTRPSRTGRGVLKALVHLAGDQVGRAPGRNAVTISAMMVGIAIMVGVGTMIGSFRHTVEIWIHQTVLADLVVAPTAWLQGEDTGMLAKRIPLAWADEVASVPGVEAVDTYRELTVELHGQPVSLVSRDLRLHAERSRYLFVSGDSAGTLERTVATEGVVVSEVLARTYGLRAGGIVRLMTPAGERDFPIQGVFYDYATDGGKVVMDRLLYRRLWQDDTTTVLAVYVATGSDREQVRRSIKDRLRRIAPDSQPGIISNGELKEEILTIFDRTFAVTYALEFIAVAIAVLGIINTLLTSVLERQRELATLRSIGASAWQVQALMLCESAYLGLFGGILGVIAGILLSVLLIEVINKQSFGWTIQFTLSAGLLLQAVGLASLAALVGGYLPARWASKQKVADGLRYE